LAGSSGAVVDHLHLGKPPGGPGKGSESPVRRHLDNPTAIRTPLTKSNGAIVRQELGPSLDITDQIE
jgi:hypothetical protein